MVRKPPRSRSHISSANWKLFNVWGHCKRGSLTAPTDADGVVSSERPPGRANFGSLRDRPSSRGGRVQYLHATVRPLAYCNGRRHCAAWAASNPRTETAVSNRTSSIGFSLRTRQFQILFPVGHFNSYQCLADIAVGSPEPEINYRGCYLTSLGRNS